MESIVIEKDATCLASPQYAGYQMFVCCYAGGISFTYNGQHFDMNDKCCAIILSNKHLENVKVTEDVKCDILCIEELFMRQKGPNNTYSIQAELSLYSNPVMELNNKERTLCWALYDNFKMRILERDHHFYTDILGTSARMLVLDMLDFHVRRHTEINRSVSSATIMTRFIELLETKEYRRNREVAYYASELNVAPKYLSEVSTKVSGFSASYWISRYTSQDICILLKEKKMKIAEIADLFNFTSVSYFNRYVKRSLGVYPSELRGK